MRYTFFEFENFKGIRKARLDLTPSRAVARVYALVGLNESGKTTVLEGIDYFRASGDEEVSPKQLGGWIAPDPESVIPIAELTNFNGNVTIRCGIELDAQDVAAVRESLRRNFDGFRLQSVERKITIADVYNYESSEFVDRENLWSGLVVKGLTKAGTKIHTITEAGDARWQAAARLLRSRLPPIWFFPNFLFAIPERIYIERTEDESEENRFFRTLLQDILDALDRELDLDKHVVARARSRKSSDKRTLEAVLLDASRDVTTTVVSAWNKIFAEKLISGKTVRLELGEEDVAPSESGETQPPKLYVEFRLEDTDGFFSISERSLGFRWFFVYLLITTYRGRRRGSSNNMLFLFDEPASNLHSTAQTALLASLAELSRHAVIIYTTHSHYLINRAWLGNTFVATNEALDSNAVSAEAVARRTDVHVTPYRQFAAHHPEQSYFFQPILSVLDYAPSKLEFVPDMVMVEGKTDYYLLTYYQEVIAQTEGQQRVRMMPGGGAGTLDQVIQLYLGWARPFIALLDSDDAGRRERQRYLDKFGSIVEPHLAGLADVAEDDAVRGLESLLAHEDKLAFQRVADPTAASFHKKTFALGVQEALSVQRSVEITDEAIRVFDRIIRNLQSRLAAVAAQMER
jgi:hypothetical protein